MAKVYKLCKKGKRTRQRNLCLDEGPVIHLIYPVSISVIIQHLAGLFILGKTTRERSMLGAARGI